MLPRSSAPGRAEAADAQLYFINFSTAKRGGVLHRHSASTCAVRSSSGSRGSVHIRCGTRRHPIRYNYLATRERPPRHDRGLKLIRRIVNTPPWRDYVRAEYLPGRGYRRLGVARLLPREWERRCSIRLSTCRIGAV